MVKYMKSGNYFETAAACTGILTDTARTWMRLGAKQKSGKYRRFFIAIKEAEAFAEASAVQRIRQYGGKIWQAEAWVLERRMPQKWGRWQREQQPDSEDEARKLTLTTKNMDQPEDDELA